MENTAKINILSILVLILIIFFVITLGVIMITKGIRNKNKKTDNLAVIRRTGIMSIILGIVEIGRILFILWYIGAISTDALSFSRPDHLLYFLVIFLFIGSSLIYTGIRLYFYNGNNLNSATSYLNFLSGLGLLNIIRYKTSLVN